MLRVGGHNPARTRPAEATGSPESESDDSKAIEAPPDTGPVTIPHDSRDAGGVTRELHKGSEAQWHRMATDRPAPCVNVQSGPPKGRADGTPRDPPGPGIAARRRLSQNVCTHERASVGGPLQSGPRSAPTTSRNTGLRAGTARRERAGAFGIGVGRRAVSSPRSPP